jgi:hypothetical protein
MDLRPYALSETKARKKNFFAEKFVVIEAMCNFFLL